MSAQRRPKSTQPTTKRSSKRDSEKVPHILIGVMGVTGVGKSNFINKITGDQNIIVGKGLKSCTKEVHSGKLFKLDGRIVELVDTPGFSDDSMTDTEVLELIARWINERPNKQQKLHGLVYIHRINDTRLDRGALRTLRLFDNICGNDYLSNTVMVTSMWDKLRDGSDVEACEETEEELKSGKWKPLLEEGAMYERSYNTKQGCEAIIRRIVEKSPKAPVLQKELDSGKSLGDTIAGAGLRGDIDERLKEHQKQVEELKLQYMKLLGANDALMKKLRLETEAREAQAQRDIEDRKKLATKEERDRQKQEELETALRMQKEETRKLMEWVEKGGDQPLSEKVTKAVDASNRRRDKAGANSLHTQLKTWRNAYDAQLKQLPTAERALEFKGLYVEITKIKDAVDELEARGMVDVEKLSRGVDRAALMAEEQSTKERVRIQKKSSAKFWSMFSSRQRL